MTIATALLTLALKNAGVTGTGQSASADDLADSLSLLNDMIRQWQLQRTVQVIPGTLATFPDLTTDVPSWTASENVLLTTLAVRLRSAYGMPADELMTQLATTSLQLFQANNLQFQPPIHGGTPTTCQQLIFLALRMAGRINDQQGVADGSADVDTAFSLLQMLVSQWQRKRWLVPSLIDRAIISTGAQSYTIGPAGAFATPRPDRIEAAYARMQPGGTNPIDYPLSIIEAHEDYASISLKSLGTFPSAVFYDSAFPVGSVYFYPVPPANVFELHLLLKSGLPVFAALSDALNLPPEYLQALMFGLAMQIAMQYGMEPKPGVVMAYRAALATIRNANLQPGVLGMPGGLGGRMGGLASGAGLGVGSPFILDSGGSRL